MPAPPAAAHAPAANVPQLRAAQPEAMPLPPAPTSAPLPPAPPTSADAAPAPKPELPVAAPASSTAAPAAGKHVTKKQKAEDAAALAARAAEEASALELQLRVAVAEEPPFANTRDAPKANAPANRPVAKIAKKKRAGKPSSHATEHVRVIASSGAASSVRARFSYPP